MKPILPCNYCSGWDWEQVLKWTVKSLLLMTVTNTQKAHLIHMQEVTSQTRSRESSKLEEILKGLGRLRKGKYDWDPEGEQYAIWSHLWKSDLPNQHRKSVPKGYNAVLKNWFLPPWQVFSLPAIPASFTTYNTTFTTSKTGSPTQTLIHNTNPVPKQLILYAEQSRDPAGKIAFNHVTKDKTD